MGATCSLVDCCISEQRHVYLYTVESMSNDMSTCRLLYQ